MVGVVALVRNIPSLDSALLLLKEKLKSSGSKLVLCPGARVPFAPLPARRADPISSQQPQDFNGLTVESCYSPLA